LEYLSRYVFRIAITDRRILKVKDGKVRFSWKDYRTSRFRQMKLDIDEFIRRFLLHVYVQPKPGGFRLNGKNPFLFYISISPNRFSMVLKALYLCGYPFLFSSTTCTPAKF
ncbi:MAG: transposase, partial [Mariniphaga sp.]